MGVPVVPSTTRQVSGTGAHLHHRNARLGQAPGQQHALATDVVTVQGTHLGIFAIQVIRLPHRRPQQQIRRHGTEAIQPVIILLAADSTLQLIPQ